MPRHTCVASSAFIGALELHFTIVTSLLMYALYLIGGQKYADNQMPADSGHASDRDVEIEVK